VTGTRRAPFTPHLRHLVQFSGQTHSPVQVAYSSDGSADVFDAVAITSSTIRNNQDARLTSAPTGPCSSPSTTACKAGKAPSCTVAKSRTVGRPGRSRSSSLPSGTPSAPSRRTASTSRAARSESGGSYPSPAYNATTGGFTPSFPRYPRRLRAGVLTSASADDLTRWSEPTAIAPAAGDRFQAEMSIAPNGRIDVSFYDRSTRRTSSSTSRSPPATTEAPPGRAAGVELELRSVQWGVPSSSASGFRPFIGDYNGMVSTDALTAITWTGWRSRSRSTWRSISPRSRSESPEAGTGGSSGP